MRQPDGVRETREMRQPDGVRETREMRQLDGVMETRLGKQCITMYLTRQCIVYNNARETKKPRFDLECNLKILLLLKIILILILIIECYGNMGNEAPFDMCYGNKGNEIERASVKRGI